MAETTPNATTAPESAPAEDAFIAEFMAKGKVEPKPEEPKAAPAAEPKAEPKDEPAPEAEAPAEDERDAGDETPEAPATESLTPKGARLAERLLTTGFRFSAERVDRLTDAELASEAMKRATETLSRAGIPKRLIDGMTPEEKLEGAIKWRPRVLEGDRNIGRNGVRRPASQDDIGEEVESLEPQPSAGARKAPTPPADDPLAEVGDALELLDDADRKKVEAVIQKLQGERQQLTGRNEAAMRLVRTNNLADAIAAVDDLMPGVAEDHEAVLQALKDQCDSLNLDLKQVAATGGTNLVRLTRLAAEQLGFAQKPRRETTEKPPEKSRAPMTPPKPKGRGGQVAPMSDDAKDLAFAQAFVDSRGDPNRAAKLYQERVSG